MPVVLARMLADLLDRHPHLQEWGAERNNCDKPQRAGVTRRRIEFVRNRVVNVPEVFQRIQTAAD